MIRWILVVALFGLAGLILYYQSEQKEVAARGAYESGYSKATDQQRPLNLTVDSLRDSLTRMAKAHAKGDSAYGKLVSMVDSLDSLTTFQSARIAGLSRPDRPNLATSSHAVRPAATQPLNSHREVLSYYRQRYESLPKDLTPYELQVSIREIRAETARKFALSQTEFERIRSTAKLTY